MVSLWVDANESRPRQAAEAAEIRLAADTLSVAVATDGLSRLQRDVVIDAVNQASRVWWMKRAEDFENAKPRPGDFHGSATREQLSARWQWCHQTAQACRNKAALIPMARDEFDAEISAILDGEAA